VLAVQADRAQVMRDDRGCLVEAKLALALPQGVPRVSERNLYKYPHGFHLTVGLDDQRMAFCVTLASCFNWKVENRDATRV
jgi:hypothetical protein